MANFSPREIVSELDRFIVGQNEAKKAVAVALRNRWRRMQVSEHLLCKQGVKGSTPLSSTQVEDSTSVH